MNRRVVAHASVAVHAGGTAGTSRDAQARVGCVDDKSEIGHGIDQRLRAAPVEASNEKRAPRREPQAMRIQSARAFDQRLEASRLHFAKGRGCANDEVRTVTVSADHVA